MTRIRRSDALRALVFLLIAMCFAVSGFAQIPQLPITQALPLPPDPAPEPVEVGQSFFGHSVAVDGRSMIVAPSSAHAAYAYKKDNTGKWVYDGALLIPDGSVWLIGAAVSNGVAAVSGCSGRFCGPASIYIFHREQGKWHFKQKLPEPAPEGNSRPSAFGFPLAIDDNLLVSSNFTDNDAKGAVYVWRKNGRGQFVYQAKLDPPEGTLIFGWSLAVQDGTIIASSQEPEGGSVHVFERSHGTWQRSRTLLSPPVTGDPFFQQYFGYSVALDGRTLIVSSPNADVVEHPRFRAGAAFVYRRMGHEWQLEKKLVNPTDHGTQFGIQVAAHGRHVAVGMWGDVFLFRRDGGAWNLEGEVMGDPNAGLGPVLAWSGPTFIASQVTMPDPNPVFDGLVEVFALPER